jgi:cytochrome c oxidase subunit I+III
LAISIPFEGLVLGLVLTLYKGRIKLTTPMLFCLASIFTVTLGGVTGVLQAFPVLDFAFRGTYWVVGHFHYVMAGTALFALLAGLYYWWPKITKRKYNEKFGKVTFAISFIGFNVLYMPYFFLLNMPRRISTYPVLSGWASLNLDATIGAYVFGPAVLLTILNLLTSYRKNEPSEPNPWDAKEMEWTGNYSGSESSPESMIKTSDTADATDSSETIEGTKAPEKVS